MPARYYGAIKLAAIIGLLMLLSAASLLTGPGMFKGSSGALNIDLNIIAISRLPRTIALLLSGGSVAVAGLVMQLLSQNHYVEPATTGTMQGAALGILAMYLFFPNAPVMVKIIMASIGALICTLIFLLMLMHIKVKSTLLVPVIGLMYAAVLTALLTFIAIHYDLLQSIVSLQSGDFSAVLKGRYEIIWIAAIITAALWWVADSFSVMAMGRSYAINVGLNYQQLILLGILAIALISGVTIAIVGALPFLGLVVPNLVRVLVGDNTRRALPWTFVIGSSLVLFCDVVGRLIVYPFEIPVGSILSVFGALLFLILLYRRA
ncbi:ABC transporter permease [Celerinatantimonas sp. MCCC 1A17872]|uniref:ABC transporter permease n=1 Tax=Celerinatantimonas sp. MCCC 1A17872 TaxID=3177514 RepID=UPI0038C8E10F